MRGFMNRMLAMALVIVLLVTNVNFVTLVSAADFYGDYTDVAKITDSNSCPSMQGLAVGSQMMYTIKIATDNTKAVIRMTDKDTGVSTVLKDASTGYSYFTGLDHANDMAVWGIDGSSHIFVATTMEGSNAIVRYKRSSSTLTKVATYHLQCGGKDICATAMDVMNVDSSGYIHLITKWGQDIYTGKVHKDSGNTTIQMTKWCTIDKSMAYIKGEKLDLSSWTNQGFGYYDDTLFVPLSGPDDQLNRSVILVYDLSKVTQTGSKLYPTDSIVFRVTSGAYSALFEIESVDICSADKKLYFNTNRRKTASDTNHDGISSIDGYTYTKPADASFDVVKHFNAKFLPNGGSGSMAVQRINNGVSTALSANAYTKTGYEFAGWTAYRVAQDQWYYTDGTTAKWYAKDAQPDGYSLYVYRDQQKVSATSNVHGDTVEFVAQWKPIDYTVTWNINGVQYAQTTAQYGDTLTAPSYSVPTGYFFSGWNVPATMPAQNITLEATSTLKHYTITWKDDGKTLGTTTVEHGQMPTYADPSKAATGEYTYTFAGWSPAVVTATGNATYTATWNKTPVQHTITFKDGDKTLGVITGNYGETVDKSKIPSTQKTGYTFNGWDKTVPSTMPSADMVINGSWTVNRYTITFNTDGGSTVSSITADYNAAITAPAAPTKTGYTFLGWSQNGTTVTEFPKTMPLNGMSLKALWEKNTVTITWNIDGKETVTQYSYGDTVTPPVATKAANGCTTYTFAGWDKTIVSATKNTTYTAIFTEGTSHTNIVTDKAVAPDCTNTGLTQGSHCEGCGKIIVAQQEIPASGHQEVPVSGYAATCTEPGLTDGVKCSVCDKMITVQQEIPAAGHSYELELSSGQKHKNATCSEAALYYVKCDHCDDINVQMTVAVGDPLDHDWADATCTAPKTCGRCGETEGDALSHVDRDNSGRCDVCQCLMQPAKLCRTSISLKGNIAINYYMLLSDEVLADRTAYMQFNLVDGEIRKVAVSEGVRYELDGEVYYVYSCTVSAKEMTDNVVSQFFYKGGSTVKHNYNVRTYAKYILDNSTNETLKGLVSAMLNYGAASQTHFGYRTGDMANAGLAAPDYSNVNISGYTVPSGQGTAGVRFCSASLILKSETTLRFFFRVDAGLENFTTTYQGKILEVKQRSGLYYVDVTGISAKDLDENVTITVNDGTGAAEVYFNPMAYCQGVQNDTTGAFGQDMKDVVAALYQYNQAANAYFKEK